MTVAKMLPFLAIIVVITAHASSNSSTIEPKVPFLHVRSAAVAVAPASSVTKAHQFLAVQGTGGSNLSTGAGPPSTLPSLEAGSVAMEAALTDLMLGKANYSATPMGGSVTQIADIIRKTMMPKVISAHKSDQSNLQKMVKEIAQCGSTKRSSLSKARAPTNVYSSNSRSHKRCRISQAALYSSKRNCLNQQKAQYNMKTTSCRHFALISKKYGTQQDNHDIVKKAGGERTEQYITRMSSTICGLHEHGPKGILAKSGGWGGGLRNSMLDKFLRAKDRCQQAKRQYFAKLKECKRRIRSFNTKRQQCNQYQSQMDSNACKAAVLVKDGCESYAECYNGKAKAFKVVRRNVVNMEYDRKSEWRGLKRMLCLITAFADGKVSNTEVDNCKKQSHSTRHLNIKYPSIPRLERCVMPTLYPSTGAYKRREFAPLPLLAKGVESAPCAGIMAMPTTPRAGSPRGAKCTRVALNGHYSAGGLIKCTNGLMVSKSIQKNSCPRGTKIFSPATRSDWKTFLASANPLRAPHWIIDVTRPQNRCAGCTKYAMNSQNRNQKSWRTSDGSPWWLRSTPFYQPSGDYSANCFLDLWHRKPANEDSVTFNDHSCNYRSKSYYCQPSSLKLTPKQGSPRSCMCSKVDLTGKYSAGVLVKCEHCLSVRKSTQKTSCPNGMKIFSPANREDWKTFFDSATPLAAPHWIIDVTRSKNGCGGCTKAAMKSSSPLQESWRTSDGSPWWLRSTRYGEPNGDYHANCFLRLQTHAVSVDNLRFNDHNCNYHSRSYYCQPTRLNKNYGGHRQQRRLRQKRQARRPQKIQRRQKQRKKAFHIPKGVQRNYDFRSLLTKYGWKMRSFTYKHHTTKADLLPKAGTCIMWGAKKQGSRTLSVAAFGRKAGVRNAMKARPNQGYLENGVYWYISSHRRKESAGFSADPHFNLHQADTNNRKSWSRLSWHLYPLRVGGYRAGRTKGLNYSTRWRKVVMYGPCVAR